MDSMGLSEMLANMLMEQGQHAEAAEIYRYTALPCVTGSRTVRHVSSRVGKGGGFDFTAALGKQKGGF